MLWNYFGGNLDSPKIRKLKKFVQMYEPAWKYENNVRYFLAKLYWNWFELPLLLFQFRRNLDFQDPPPPKKVLEHRPQAKTCRQKSFSTHNPDLA